VGYWLSLPENRRERDRVHNLTGKPKQQIAELDRLAAKLDHDGTFADTTAKPRAEDEYIVRRRMDIKSGKRRRP
jgi:hypothetical protein